MYAPNQDQYTYSSSPEDDDVNSVISPSLFDRIEAINNTKIGDAPAILPADGYLNNAAVAAGAAAPTLGPSSIGSSPSLNILAKTTTLDNQGYGQLQEQYGYNISLKGLPSLGANCNDNRLSGGCGDNNVASINNVVMNSGGQQQQQQQQQQLDEEPGRRQYQEVMSTPPLPSIEHQKKETSISIGENHFMPTSNNTTAVADSTMVPILPGSSLLHTNESSNNNKGNENKVASTSTDNTYDTNNTQEERPMIFNGKGSFPLNLALMLESVERPWDGCNGGKMNHIVSWLPCGSGFVIHDTELFLSEVLPRYFKSNKTTKIRSFYRKLNRWGFSVLRSSQLNKSGTMNSVKNAWHHSEFSRERAKECLALAQKSGDTDYSSILSVSHVHFRETNSGGGDGRRKRRASKRESDFSVESMDTSNRGDEFNYSLPSLDRQVSLPNKRGGSFNSASQRMSWTAGDMRNDYGLGSFASNNANSQLGNQSLNQSWTTGSDLSSNMAMNVSQLPPDNFMRSWTAGMNTNPMVNSSQPRHQSWTVSSGFAPNNASQLIQLNHLMNNQMPSHNNNGNDFYNEWKKMVMQGGAQNGGSSIFGQGQQQQQQHAWSNDNSTTQQGTPSLQSVNNGNAFGTSSAHSGLQQQQWSQSQLQQQGQMQEFGGVQQGQKQQTQNQGNLQESGPQNQGGGGGEMTQEDVNLRSFFEKFAERMGNDGSGK